MRENAWKSLRTAGIKDPFASFGCMAVLVTARRSVGQAVYLYIAVPRANIRICRRQCEPYSDVSVGRPYYRR